MDGRSAPALMPHAALEETSHCRLALRAKLQISVVMKLQAQNSEGYGELKGQEQKSCFQEAT